jgi:hypothetical protein
MADSDIIVSLHLVIPFISMAATAQWQNSQLTIQRSRVQIPQLAQAVRNLKNKLWVLSGF